MFSKREITFAKDSFNKRNKTANELIRVLSKSHFVDLISQSLNA